MNYILESNRLGFRQWKESDRTPFIALNADPKVMEFFPDVMSADEVDAMLTRMVDHITKHGFGFYAVDLLATGEFIGFLGLGIPRFELDFGPFVEIGWRTKQSSWGQGYATEGANALLDYGFNTLGLHTIYSMTAIQNKKSEHIMKKIGMSYDRFFDMPLLPEISLLRRHSLYHLDKEEYLRFPKS